VFAPAAEADELRRLTVKGAGASVFSSSAGLAIQIIATLWLARLLAPADFGVVTMVTTFSLLLTSFGLNGFSEAILQREEINEGLISNLFWINLGAGLVLTLTLAASGPVLAWFYKNTHVIAVAVGMSATIFLTSLSVQHLALLKRAMRFSSLAGLDISSRAASVGVSILLGWMGWGYWALVAGAVAQPVVTCVGAYWLCRWVPSFPRRVPGTGAMVRFALAIYGRFTVNYSARNLDNVLVGWRFDARSLGFYKKAYDLFALSASQLVAPLTIVAVAALSRLTKDAVQYRRYLLRALAMMALLGMGVGADLTLVGQDMIRVLLGPGWSEAGRIFMFFGPGIGIMLIYNTHGWIHLSIGTPDRWFHWGIVEFGATALLFLAGLPYGPVGIAVAWTVSFWALTIPAFWYAGKPIGLGPTVVLGAVWRYLAASVAAGLATAEMMRLMPSLAAMPAMQGAIVRIVTASSIFFGLYLAGVVALHGSAQPISQFFGLLVEMLSRRRAPAAPSSTDVAGEVVSAALPVPTLTRQEVTQQG
jgi:PST family polysaccharide transporter